MSRTEILTRIDGSPVGTLAPGVELRTLATGAMGAEHLTTCLATFAPGTELPCHTHPTSEVIVLVSGAAEVTIEQRRYRLRPYAALHVPAGTPHAVRNATDAPAVLHTSFATATPTRDLVPGPLQVEDREASDDSTPETLVRFELAPVYELAPQAHFRDLFARRFGARGVCGGYGLFQPGASLPCHYHDYDESITIVEGTAICQVAGREYSLTGCDTACIPRARPHRFLNRSDRPMAMIWVYAGDEPERTLVDAGCCERGDPIPSVS